jgi:hypothetical protein
MRTAIATLGHEILRPLRSAVGAVSSTLFVLAVLAQGLLVIAMLRVRSAGAKSPVDLAHAIRAQLSKVLPAATADAVAALEPFVWTTIVLAAALLPLLIVVLGRDCLASRDDASARSRSTAAWVARRAAALLASGVVLVALAAAGVAGSAAILLPAGDPAELARGWARVVGIAALAALPAVGITVLAHAVLRRAWATPWVGLAALWLLAWLDLALESRLARTLIPTSYDIAALFAPATMPKAAAVHVLWGVLLCALAAAWIELRARSASAERLPSASSSRYPAGSPAPLAASPEVER